MGDFKDRLSDIGRGESPDASKLTFLSDLSSEDRTTFREAWLLLPTERRRQIVRHLVSMAEDNIDYHFRMVFLAALEDADPQVRLAAIEGLYEDESRLLLSRLLDILRLDPDEEVREAASMALGRFVYQAECDKDKLGDQAGKLRDTLLQSARDQSETPDVRRRAIEALGYLHGDKDVRELVNEAYRAGGRQAESALFAMGRSMDTRWELVVLGELESDRAPMRYEAARAAGEMALADALPMLVRMVDDCDLEVRLAAIWALGQIGGKPAAEALGYALKSNEPAIRDAAHDALEEISFAYNPLNIVS